MRIGLRVIIQSTRSITNAAGEKLELPKGTVLEGELSVEAWDGPLGIREYKLPSYYKIEYRCSGPLRPFVYRGCLTPFDFCFVDGEQLWKNQPIASIIASADPLSSLIDTRTQLNVSIDGEKHELHTKYMSFEVQLHAQQNMAVFWCNFFHSEFGGMRQCWFARPYESLLFLGGTKLYYTPEGEVEDFEAHCEEYVDFQFEG